ncbi:hypothetical protein AB9L18_02425 [Stenotrophomonas lactitubi]|uniref:hypothetical protein n=1 Tax=Stenotrophomonas lactitubi TaxID=2045214 RepID=UPI0035C0AE0D
MENGVPIITASAGPFRLVVRGDSDAWSATLDDINGRTYDYVKLHRLSTYFDVGIAPFSLGVCYDGTMILPATEAYRNRDTAFSKFNQTLAELLVGGIYCEAPQPDDIGYGSMSQEGYSRIMGGATGPSASVRNAARMKMLSSIDSMSLMSPEVVTVAEMEAALKRGRDLLAKLGSVPQEQMLHGTTFYARKQWAESLLHLWTTTERVLETAWTRHVMAYQTAPSKSRREFLSDHRTWTAATKLEVLFQKDLLPEHTYDVLTEVRKARNAFAHRGIAPGYEIARQALVGCFEMASLCASTFTERDLFKGVVDVVERRCRPDLFPPRERDKPLQPTHWLAIPPLPGDKHWGDEPYEVIEELRLKPIPTPRR